MNHYTVRQLTFRGISQGNGGYLSIHISFLMQYVVLGCIVRPARNDQCYDQLKRFTSSPLEFEGYRTKGTVYGAIWRT